MIWKFTYYCFLCILPIEIKKTRKKNTQSGDTFCFVWWRWKTFAISELKTC